MLPKLTQETYAGAVARITPKPLRSSGWVRKAVARLAARAGGATRGTRTTSSSGCTGGLIRRWRQGSVLVGHVPAPVAMLYFLLWVTGIPPTEAQALAMIYASRVATL